MSDENTTSRAPAPAEQAHIPNSGDQRGWWWGSDEAAAELGTPLSSSREHSQAPSASTTPPLVPEQLAAAVTSFAPPLASERVTDVHTETLDAGVKALIASEEVLPLVASSVKQINHQSAELADDTLEDPWAKWYGGPLDQQTNQVGFYATDSVPADYTTAPGETPTPTQAAYEQHIEQLPDSIVEMVYGPFPQLKPVAPEELTFETAIPEDAVDASAHQTIAEMLYPALFKPDNVSTGSVIPGRPAETETPTETAEAETAPPYPSDSTAAFYPPAETETAEAEPTTETAETAEAETAPPYPSDSTTAFYPPDTESISTDDPQTPASHRTEQAGRYSAEFNTKLATPATTHNHELTAEQAYEATVEQEYSRPLDACSDGPVTNAADSPQPATQSLPGPSSECQALTVDADPPHRTAYQQNAASPGATSTSLSSQPVNQVTTLLDPKHNATLAGAGTPEVGTAHNYPSTPAAPQLISGSGNDVLETSDAPKRRKHERPNAGRKARKHTKRERLDSEIADHNATLAGAGTPEVGTAHNYPSTPAAPQLISGSGNDVLETSDAPKRRKHERPNAGRKARKHTKRERLDSEIADHSAHDRDPHRPRFSVAPGPVKLAAMLLYTAAWFSAATAAIVIAHFAGVINVDAVTGGRQLGALLPVIGAAGALCTIALPAAAAGLSAGSRLWWWVGLGASVAALATVALPLAILALGALLTGGTRSWVI